MSDKLFDYIIGNPPYMEQTESDSTRMPPVYNEFMEASYGVGSKVELITPARFLFNAGYTPKEWNKKMLEDEHLKVLSYEQNSASVFPNTDIMGGVVVTYRDEEKVFGAIQTFTTFPELNSILKKVNNEKFISISNIVAPALSYKLSSKMIEENPNALHRLRTSCFTTLHEIFFEQEPDDEHEYMQMIGILKNKRTYRFVRRDYIKDSYNKTDYYKVILPASNGSGAIGETIPTPIIGQPLVGHPLLGYTQSFISVGRYNNKTDAENCYKYICSKFARTLLGIMKATQHNPPDKWTWVPLQDFTPQSDIDWTKSIHEIDLQLYKKYGLSDEEINFIETNVKEMV